MPHRRVFWMHRPTNPISERGLNGLTNWYWKFNHNAIFVENNDPADNSVYYSVFELELDDNKEIIRPPRDRIVDNLNGWRGASWFISPIENGPDVKGVTSFTDEEIRGYASVAIASIERYSVTTNNCKNFAASLFDMICNIERSTRAKLWHLNHQMEVAASGGSFKGYFNPAAYGRAVKCSNDLFASELKRA